MAAIVGLAHWYCPEVITLITQQLITYWIKLIHFATLKENKRLLKLFIAETATRS